MAILRQNGPYIWVTWLTKLLVGENSCEWAAWFRAQHEGGSWGKVPGDFNLAAWQLKHTDLLGQVRVQLEADAYSVFTENQNSFVLRGRTSALGGKPDLIATKNGQGVILDIKTGTPSPSHHIQVMTYMYAVPRALGQYKGMAFDGRIVYPDHEEEIPESAVDDTFIKNLAALIQRLASSTPARKIPSPMECGFCNITTNDCADRMDGNESVEGKTSDF